MCVVSHLVMSDSETHWTVAQQAPQALESFRQQYWSRLLLPIPGDPPNPGMEPMPLVSFALAGRFFTTVPLGWYHNINLANAFQDFHTSSGL